MAELNKETLDRLNNFMASDKFSQLNPETQERVKKMLGTAPAPEPAQETSTMLTDPLQTLQRSGGKFLGELGEAISHPVRTGKAIGSLGLGAVEKLIPGEQKHEKTFNALGDFYKERYGSLEKAKNLALEDPVGFLSDLSIFATGGGAAVAKVGTVSKLGKVAKVGRVVGKVGKAVDPLANLVKGAGVATRAATRGKTIAPFLKSADKGAIKAASDLGVDLPASAKVGNKAVPLVEAFVAKGPFGGKLASKIENAQARLIQVGDDLIKKTGRSSDLNEVGNLMVKGVDDFRARFFQIKNDLYKKAGFNERAKGIVFTPENNNALKFVDDILKTKKDAEGLLGSAKDIQFFRNLSETLRGKLVEVKAPQKFDAIGMPIKTSKVFKRKMVSATEVKSAIDELNNKMGSFTDEVVTGNKASLKKLVTMLSNELDEVVANQNPALYQEIKRANHFFKLGIEEVNSSFAQKIFKLRDTPDKIVPGLFNKSMGQNDIKRIYRIIGKENVPSVQSAFLEQFLLKAKSGDNFTPMGISKQIKGFSPEKLKQILTPEQFKAINQLDDLSQGLGRVGKVIGGSQTSFTARVAAIIGPFFIDPFLSLKLLGIDFGASKAVSSGLGQKLLSTGIKLKGGTGQKLIDVSDFTGQAGRGLRLGELTNKSKEKK